jgi:hypothetical protein
MLKFGRFSDAFKPKQNIDKWNECEKLFDEKKYTDSYKIFFEYLKDPETENVFYSQDGSSLKFQVLQGSKEIKGYANEKSISALVLIAEYEKLGIPVMRRLMEMNYSLYYSRFAIKDNKVILKFDSSIPGCPPRKLYYALKEIAIRADKQDDMLLDEFSALKPFDTHITEYDDSEKHIRIKYFRKWISEALSFVSGLKRDDFTGGISYIYLNQIYRIDYLLQPQGYVNNELEKLSWKYFNTKDVPLEALIEELENGLKKLLEIPDDILTKCFYEVRSTFGITPPAGKDAADNVITSNIHNVKWYIENKHESIALNILEYIAGYSLFTYGLNKSLNSILGIIIEILNADYLREIQYGIEYFTDGSLNRELILNKLEEVLKTDSADYPELKLNTDMLKFDTKYNFIKSLFEEILKFSYK